MKKILFLLTVIITASAWAQTEKQKEEILRSLSGPTSEGTKFGVVWTVKSDTIYTANLDNPVVIRYPTFWGGDKIPIFMEFRLFSMIDEDLHRLNMEIVNQGPKTIPVTFDFENGKSITTYMDFKNALTPENYDLTMSYMIVKPSGEVAKVDYVNWRNFLLALLESNITKMKIGSYCTADFNFFTYSSYLFREMMKLLATKAKMADMYLNY